MPEKNFRERLNDEMSRFAQIYEELQEDYISKHEKPDGQPNHLLLGVKADAWKWLFVTPIQVSEPEVYGGNALRSDLRKALNDTVEQFKLNELRLAPLGTTSGQIWDDLKDNVLSRRDLEFLYKMPIPDQISKAGYYVTREKVLGSDPFFWRTLLEIFCRVFTAKPNRPLEWLTRRKISLGCDLWSIWQSHFKDGGFSNQKALVFLRRNYRKKYHDSGKWKVGIKAVNDLMRKCGPMDDDFLWRLKALDPQLFITEFEKHFFGKTPTNLEDLLSILKRKRRF
jgi:hypothetical protein